MLVIPGQTIKISSAHWQLSGHGLNFGLNFGLNSEFGLNFGLIFLVSFLQKPYTYRVLRGLNGQNLF